MSAPLFADDYQLQGGRPEVGRLSWRLPGGALFVILVTLTLGSALSHLLDPGTLPIRYVRINGEFRHLSPASLQEAASDVVRGGFFNVNVDTVRAVLMREPWVRDVIVRRVWPDSLSLHVAEQVPVARWADAALLNDAAQIFAPDPATWPSGLPRISGPAGTESALLEQYRHMTAALAPLRLKVARVDLNERRSLSLTIEQGPEVVLGRKDSMNRFDRFTTVLPGHLLETLARIAVVDMRYTNGFAVRWKGGAASELTEAREEHGEKD